MATNFERRGEESNANNQDNALERFEMIEAMLRVAVEWFVDSEQVGVAGRRDDEAVEMLIGQLVVAKARREDAYVFRRSALYCDATEAVFLAFWKDLKLVFAHYQDINPMDTGGQRMMSLKALTSLFVQSKYIDPNFTREECKLAFVLSKSVYVDEMKTQRHTMLSWVDFLEAVGRSSRYKKLPPTYLEPEADVRPAHVKITAALHMLFSGCVFHAPLSISNILHNDGLANLGIHPSEMRLKPWTTH